jgi:autotransporter-associated beta strand protein/T5SS/PEP-CTERM-associated repeat protein
MRSYRRRSQAPRAAAPAAPSAAIQGGAILVPAAATRATFSRAALLGSAWLGAVAILVPNATYAQNGTWVGATPDWNTPANWTPVGVPTDTATFSNTGVTNVTSSNASINTIDFTAAAPAYSFTIDPFTTFSINGTGITNASAFAPNFTNNGLIFFNSGTAANAAITNNGSTSFLGSSSAGSSTIINSGSGSLISFSDTSTAGNATITTNGGALTQFAANSNGGNARFITNAGGTVDFSGTTGPGNNGRITAGSIEGAGTYSIGSNELTVGSNDLSTALSGSIQDGGAGGSLVKVGSGTLTLTGSSNIGGDLTLSSCGCAAGGVTISGGSFTAGSFVEIDGGTLAVTNGGTLQTTDILVAGNMIVTGAGSTVTASGVTVVGFFGPGSLTIANGGVFNSQGGSEIDTFVPELGIPSVLVTGPGSTWNVGGPALFVGGGSTEGPGMLTVANGGTVNATAPMFIGDVTGTSAVTVTGAGSVLNAFNSLTIGGVGGCGCGALAGTLTIADGGVVNSPGPTLIGAGSTLNLGAGGLAGAINTPAIANDGGQIVANFTDTLTLAAAISGTGTLTKLGPGTLMLTANNSYSGATTIDGGTLIVNGSIANSPVTVNAGGTLAGTGTVGTTTINSGGTFAPGNSPGTMTVAGNLAFQSGALYVVQVNPSTASSTNVTAAGSATLAGTVQAVFAPGSYLSRRYTILSAAGGRSGTFNALTTANLPAGFSASLSYTATDAILNLTAALGGPGLGGLGGPGNLGAAGFNGNQRNVANALNAFFNNGGTLPPAFVTIFDLTGANLANALTLLSGEPATGAQQGAFALTTQFLGQMGAA